MEKQYKSIMPSYLLYAIIVLSLSIASCDTTKYLAEGESYIKSSEVHIIDSLNEVKGSEKTKLKEDLSGLIMQKQNGSILFIPREYIYFVNSDKDDTTSINKWFRNKIGEPPALYSRQKLDRTAKKMQNLLRIEKGFLNAEVKTDTLTKKKKTWVNYNINLNEKFYIGDVEFFGRDTVVMEKIKEVEGSSFLKKGNPLEKQLFDLETYRLVDHLQNNGFVDFNQKYIKIHGDSTKQANVIDIFIEILPFENGLNHRQYKVGKIDVYTDFYPKQDTITISSELINGITYFREEQNFIVKPKIIEKAITLVPNTLATKEHRLETFKNLSNLSAYKFTAVQPKTDKNDSTKINYEILLTPHTYKWKVDYGADFFNSTITQSDNNGNLSRTLLGFGISGQLFNKNARKRSEKNIITSSISTQLQLGQTKDSLFRVFNASLVDNYEFSTFSDPIKLINTLSDIKILSDEMYNKFKKNSISNFDIGLNYSNIRDFYNILSVGANFGYKFSDNSGKYFNITQTGVNINYYDLKPKFIDRIDSNEYIINSLSDNLFTGILFRNISFGSSPIRKEKGLYFGTNASLELSGGEVFLANKLANAITGNTNHWTINNQLNFSKYIRFELENKIYKNFSKRSSIVGRLHGGLIIPYGDNIAAPYIKQFNVGGPNSMRAWESRSLGPGSTLTYLSSPGSIPFSQGDVKLEANLEYRFDIWWLIEGAFFVDVGNIWFLKSEDKYSNISSQFYKDLAVGAGWGLRWDFDYFLIRFDLGYKLRNPVPDPISLRNWNSLSEIFDQKLGNLQVAVNYPF